MPAVDLMLLLDEIRQSIEHHNSRLKEHQEWDLIYYNKCLIHLNHPHHSLQIGLFFNTFHVENYLHGRIQVQGT